MAAAEEISAAHGLEPDWLNDAAKGFLPGPDEHPHTVFESASLLVQVASPEYLLAMKLHASRDEHDLDDAATLFIRLGYTTAEELIDLLSHTYPPARLLPRHYYLAADIAQRAVERLAVTEPSEPPESERSRLRPSIRHENRRAPHPPPTARSPEPPGISF